MTILSVQNLTVSLDGKKVLDDVNFDVDAGDSLAIIGPNGSGKTVLLKSLLGILPYTGKIEWSEKTFPGYVPQKVDADRHLPLTFSNLLAAKAQVLKLPASDIALCASKAGLTQGVLNTPVGHLSGGQFQRGLIAFAILGKPKVLLFDEPTASIDQPGEEQIYEVIHRLQDEFGITVILVSHDLSFVYRYATKVLCLNHNNVCFGAPQDVLTSDTLSRLYGGEKKLYHHIHPEEH